MFLIIRLNFCTQYTESVLLEAVSNSLKFCTKISRFYLFFVLLLSQLAILNSL